MRWFPAVGVLYAVLALGACDRVFSLERFSEEPIVDDDVHDATVQGDECPADYIATPLGDRYKLYFDASTWSDAKVRCEGDAIAGSSRYTHLAVLRDRHELEDAAGLAADTTPWVGLVDLDGDGTYRWLTAEPDATQPWDTSRDEPDAPGVHRCARLGGPFGLDSADCPVRRVFLCECDAYPSVL